MTIQYLEELFQVVKKRTREKPEGSYVASIVKEGLGRVLGKFGEEAFEFASAVCGSGDKVSEAADLLFHYFIVLAASGIELEDVVKELEGRRRH
ncbi:MAG: phosphoribosyl-ATP diphosphatase [Candidatus Brockarchaeota archaeon]|nr:phosphoribosyl-ATP diphosphatase [Candidatus Brockarchaeota archaeon]